LDRAEESAAGKGGEASQEDSADGYRLLKRPAGRSLELEVRKYAVAHEAELLRVLGSSADARQREIAADALGYARRSPTQVAALVRASRDADDDVRNNAIRALAELAAADPGTMKQIGPETFIEMVASGHLVLSQQGRFSAVAVDSQPGPRAAGAAESAGFGCPHRDGAVAGHESRRLGENDPGPHRRHSGGSTAGGSVGAGRGDSGLGREIGSGLGKR
jgi:hypothetical protein